MRPAPGSNCRFSAPRGLCGSRTYRRSRLTRRGSSPSTMTSPSACALPCHSFRTRTWMGFGARSSPANRVGCQPYQVLRQRCGRGRSAFGFSERRAHHGQCNRRSSPPSQSAAEWPVHWRASGLARGRTNVSCRLRSWMLQPIVVAIRHRSKSWHHGTLHGDPRRKHMNMVPSACRSNW